MCENIKQYSDCVQFSLNSRQFSRVDIENHINSCHNESMNFDICIVVCYCMWWTNVLTQVKVTLPILIASLYACMVIVFLPVASKVSLHDQFRLKACFAIERKFSGRLTRLGLNQTMINWTRPGLGWLTLSSFAIMHGLSTVPFHCSSYILRCHSLHLILHCLPFTWYVMEFQEWSVNRIIMVTHACPSAIDYYMDGCLTSRGHWILSCTQMVMKSLVTVCHRA